MSSVAVCAWAAAATAKHSVATAIAVNRIRDVILLFLLLPELNRPHCSVPHDAAKTFWTPIRTRAAALRAGDGMLMAHLVPSHLGRSAIDEQLDARHEAGLVGGEK